MYLFIFAVGFYGLTLIFAYVKIHRKHSNTYSVIFIAFFGRCLAISGLIVSCPLLRGGKGMVCMLSTSPDLKFNKEIY